MLDIERFKSAVEYWQQAFGLAEFNIIVREGPAGAETQCRVEVKYLRAVIDVAPDLVEDVIEHTACHEVAHVFLGEFVQHASDLLEYFGPVQRGPMNDAWSLASERTTERLARLMEARGA